MRGLLILHRKEEPTSEGMAVLVGSSVELFHTQNCAIGYSSSLSRLKEARLNGFSQP